MYDELVKALHEGAEFLECSTPGIKNSFAKMCHNGADAIEELQKVVMRLEEKSGILDELPMYQQPCGWIPVTERVPELNENVLVYSAHSGLIRIDANIWFDRNATHWMPLPEPPEEE